MSAALASSQPKRIDLLLAQCGQPRRVESHKPVLERLREKIGVELTRLLLFALAGNQPARSARRG